MTRVGIPEPAPFGALHGAYMSISPTGSPDELLPPDSVAALVSISIVTLTRWRRLGTGPRFVKVGRRIVYRRGAVEAWLGSREFASTAEVRVRERGAA